MLHKYQILLFTDGIVMIFTSKYGSVCFSINGDLLTLKCEIYDNLILDSPSFLLLQELVLMLDRC